MHIRLFIFLFFIHGSNVFGQSTLISQEKVNTDKENLWKFLYASDKNNQLETVLDQKISENCDTLKVVYKNYDQPFYESNDDIVSVITVESSQDCDSLMLENAKTKELVLSDNQMLMATLINDSIKGKVSMDSIKVVNAKDYQDILDSYGFYDFLDVTFRVQVGAYKNKDSFNKNVFGKYGLLQKYTLADDITRFTVGDFSYLRQADDLKKKIRLEGHPDVFVVVFKNGKRQFDFNFKQ